MTDAPEDDQLTLAKLAYQAYGQQTGNKTFDGRDMPTWDALGDQVQGAWVAAVDAVANYLEGPPAVDEIKGSDARMVGH